MAPPSPQCQCQCQCRVALEEFAVSVSGRNNEGGPGDGYAERMSLVHAAFTPIRTGHGRHPMTGYPSRAGSTGSGKAVGPEPACSACLAPRRAGIRTDTQVVGRLTCTVQSPSWQKVGAVMVGGTELSGGGGGGDKAGEHRRSATPGVFPSPLRHASDASGGRVGIMRVAPTNA